MKNIKAEKFDSWLDDVFTEKDSNNNYSVYLLTENQGRGTDLKSNADIELNGGNYLILADVFSLKSQ